MKSRLGYLLCLVIILSGCSTTANQIKAESPGTELVEAEGIAPVINGDLAGAKQTSLHEALKSALGLVVGVYVSQEALVSKAMLIEDNITSRTEGYIEKYTVLGELQENSFYKTRVKALVRKQDLSAKLQTLDLEPKQLGNPTVKIAVEEWVDGKAAPDQNAADVLKNQFIALGFKVADAEAADILITGKVESNLNPDAGLEGLVSYRATFALKAWKAGTQEIVSTVNEKASGVDVTQEAAARTAIVKGAKKIGQILPQSVLAFLRTRAAIRLNLSGVIDLNQLNQFVHNLRSLPRVKDCRTQSYSSGAAVLDIAIRQGDAADMAKDFETMARPKVKVAKTTAYTIDAEAVPY